VASLGVTPRAERISEADVARLQAAVPRGHVSSAVGGDRNPPAIFILSPPRSGTTLLRIMLAGHRDLFSATELQLLGFGTMQERANAYVGRFSGWLDGLIRSVMDIERLDAEAAKATIHAAEAEGVTTKAFYRRLQDAIQPRLLVDKSPSYAMDPGALRKAEADFDGALYIHLVRNPVPMIESFIRHHMDQVLHIDEHPFTPRQLAELLWTLSHRNVVEFLTAVPRERWVRVRFEDLVTDPEAQMETLCRSLGLPFDPAVLRPYEGVESKMVDGVYPESAPMGDPNFLARGRIDPTTAQMGTEPAESLALGAPTLELAASFGYDLGGNAGQGRRPRRDSLARQRELRMSGRQRDVA